MAWVVVGGAAVSVIGGALLSDDNGAEAANGAAADANRLQGEIARDQWERYKTVYAPLEESMVADASKYDSPENLSRAASDASATVSQQYGKARDRLTRTPGLDPASGAFQAGLTGLELSQAATDATQQNVARQKVKDMAYARKTDAISLGKGLPASASSMLSTSANNSLSMANAAQGQANATAGAFGRITDRVFSSPTVSNWLGNVGAANTYGTNIGSQQTNMLQAQEIGL